VYSTFLAFVLESNISVFSSAPWYTNPQTEAFCAMLEIANKINPPPPQDLQPPSASTEPSAPSSSETERPGSNS
jgi:Lariat debranching enzyme, C-terminal domain